MHIPDGYLSPSTCAALYTASVPCWYVALKRAKSMLTSRTIPLVSVFAAFSFVVMMFNLPLPGGTTGHAVGVGMASIVLGPWISILAISIALLVQALLFGDGGITAFGANCFNMAVVGSVISFLVYRMAAFRAAIDSKRRIAAAGLAGYAAINVAALCAAVEFGLQPILFHDSAGTPLYAPYPLSVSIPAMMIGHLTFAGLAELVLCAGMIAYIQASDPDLLRGTAPDAAPREHMNTQTPHTVLLPTRRLLAVLALLLVLTPLGIVAGGSAWGEWRAQSFSDPAARKQIAAASRDYAPPAQVPRGLDRLLRIWQAPLSEYAPGFIRNPFFGYFVSGTVGVGVILFLAVASTLLIPRLRGIAPESSGLRRLTFVEKTVHRLARAADEALFAEEIARAEGWLQSIDPRAKLAALGSLVIVCVAVHELRALGALLIFTCILAFASRIRLSALAMRVWLPVLAFTGLIAAPAVFLVPGQTFATGSVLPVAVSRTGLRAATLLVLRAECAATIMFLLIVTTPWSHLLRSLRWLRLPVSAVALLEISYRYVFVLLKTAEDLFDARQTRLVGKLEPKDQRRFASSAAVALLDKSFQLSGEVHLAMQARGFRGNVFLLDDLRMTARNWFYAVSGVALAIAIAVWGR